jgi:hypothetical protein
MDRERAALEAGWRFFLAQQGDTPFAEVVATIRAQCPSVGVERIRAEFRQRLRAWCGLAVAEFERPVRGENSRADRTVFASEMGLS